VRLDALDHVAVIVRDLPAAMRFYEDVLGLHRVHEQAWGEYPVALVAGSSAAGVALFPVGEAGLPDETDENAHFAFRTSPAGYEQAKAELTARGIPFDEWDHHVAWSIYFRDPDGHQLEITAYDGGG
jgi:catechol 2,3-dioxygenase-like lactoylglutathione lyase family enzyme